MRQMFVSLWVAAAVALPAQGVEFLGIELCQDSKTTAVVLPPDSQLTVESVEIGKHGGLVMLVKAEGGDVLDHLDNLMSRYTGSRGTGDRKTLQWAGGEITAFAQVIKKGHAALAVSTTDECLASPAPQPVEPAEQPVAAIAEPQTSDTADLSDVPVATAAGGTTAAAAASAEAPPEAAAAIAAAPDFELRGDIKHSPSEGAWVDVMGVVVNSSGSSYKIANFDLSLYDAAGDLICVDAISVSELRNGQERAFRDSIRCADYSADGVASWKLQFAGGH